MEQTKNNEKKQTGFSLLSIALSVIGCVIGFFDKTASSGGFGIGMIITFVAVLVSLMSVKDKGHNLLAKAAFFLSVAALFTAVGFGAIR